MKRIVVHGVRCCEESGGFSLSLPSALLDTRPAYAATASIARQPRLVSIATNTEAFGSNHVSMDSWLDQSMQLYTATPSGGASSNNERGGETVVSGIARASSGRLTRARGQDEHHSRPRYPLVHLAQHGGHLGNYARTTATVAKER
jgi:hypothetical protein